MSNPSKTAEHEKMMREVDSDDWALLNAYADRELDRTRRAEVEARLAAEPHLKSELDRIRKLKRDLASLRPNPAMGSTGRRKSTGRLRAAALAASLCLLFVSVVLFATLYVKPEPEDGIFSVHERLAGQTYVVEERRVEQVVSTGRAFEFNAPDLTASRLFLVDVKSVSVNKREFVGLHYRGLNGCRLTLVAFEGEMGPVSSDPRRYLVRSWSFGGFGFAIIASGMDAMRFRAVGEYAEAVINRELKRQEENRTAMTRTARRSCA